MKTESKPISENATDTINITTGMLCLVLLVSIFTSCTKELGRQNTQDKAIAAQLAAVRMQMGIVEGNEHVAR